MNQDKMSAEEVPQRFKDWLLQMGCPPEKIPSLDKMTEMCRGQYYMVWRSLMEHVRPKDEVRQQRLQVFCDDVQKCSDKPRSAVVPKELSTWREHAKLKQMVESEELAVCDSRNQLEKINANVSKKLAQRNMSTRALQDAQRRVWALQSLEEELKTKKDNLNETLGIAREMSQQNDVVDVENKLEKCLNSVKSHLQSPSSSVPVTHPIASSAVCLNSVKSQYLQIPSSSVPVTHPVASSSVASNKSNTDDDNEQLSEIGGSHGDVIWKLLYEKRSNLEETLKKMEPPTTTGPETTPQMVLAHTSALHCQLDLETMKQKLQQKQTRKELVVALTKVGKTISKETSETFVLNCEKTDAEARVATLKKLLLDVTNRSGEFDTGLVVSDEKVTPKHIVQIDKKIINKRDNIKNLLAKMSTTEAKINMARKILQEIFGGLRKGVDGLNSYGDKVFEKPCAKAVSSLVQYFQRRNEIRMARVELSLNLDLSEGSPSTSENKTFEAKFVDELRLYLKIFNLERNRKLVLESGEKMWAFETLQASADRVLAALIAEELPCHFMCPSVTMTERLTKIAYAVQLRDRLITFCQAFEGKTKKKNICFDLVPYKSEEEAVADNIKKRLHECLISLSKSNRIRDGACENLNIWRENEIKRYISNKRTLRGRCYEDWEKYFLSL